MGTTLFPFTPRGSNLDEDFYPREIVTPEEGAMFKRVTADRLVVRGLELLFPDTPAGALQFSDWVTWWRTTIGKGAESFLYKPRRPALYIVQNEAIGTAAGGGGETFALANRFVHHTDFGEAASTLVVEVETSPGVWTVQTITTDYTVSGNGTAPLVTSEAAMDTGDVRASYQRYFQVFAFKERTRVLVPGGSLAAQGTDRVFLTLLEQKSGGHLA